MSDVLLDTRALIWLLDGNRALAPSAVEMIERAAHEGTVWVSAISPWEIAMPIAKGRLALTRDVYEGVDEALRQPGIALAPLEPAIASASTRLPGPSRRPGRSLDRGDRAARWRATGHGG